MVRNDKRQILEDLECYHLRGSSGRLWSKHLPGCTFLEGMEGIPYGPGAKFAESLSRANITSSLSKITLSRYSVPSSIEKKLSAVTAQLTTAKLKLTQPMHCVPPHSSKVWPNK